MAGESEHSPLFPASGGHWVKQLVLSSLFHSEYTTHFKRYNERNNNKRE